MVRNKSGNKLAKGLALKLYVLSSFQFNDIYPLGYFCVYISTHTQKETNRQTEMRGKETASNGTPTKPFLSPFGSTSVTWVGFIRRWNVPELQYCCLSSLRSALATVLRHLWNVQGTPLQTGH